MSTPASNETEPVRGRRQVLGAVVASTIGTTIEWYDFFLYGSAAALVFPKLFFPDKDPFVALILSFSTFTVGFLSRPLGGIIFGHLGDRKGRKAALVATLLLMGVSTLLVGLVPTHERIGVMAPLALVVLRILQGIGVGGEWGGAVLLALETGHRGKRGFFASCPQAGVPLGLLLSTGVLAAFIGGLSDEAFMSWGWRIPFLLSAVLIVVGLLIRIWVAESPLFSQLKDEDRVAKAPVLEVLRHNSREILLGAGSRFGENACFYVFAMYVLSYGESVLEVDRSLVLAAVMWGAAGAIFTIPLFGFLSDIWSRKGLYLAGNGLLLLFAFPYYALLENGSAGSIMLASIVALAVVHAMLYSVQASLLPELFSTRLRYTGASLSYQLAGPVAGGLAPIICASLAHQYPGQYWPLAVYLILISLISIVCIWQLGETARKDISGTE